MLRGRSEKGHWFGTVVDAPDPQALGMFYHRVLGWRIHKNEPNEFVLAVPGNSETYLSFQPQRSAPWVRRTWPAAEGRQQMMMHLDIEVGSLDVAVERALELGATLADFQPQNDVRVLLDPALQPESRHHPGHLRVRAEPTSPRAMSLLDHP
ncbi:VOC family protein [Kribbella turkmenica]|uniref:VOC family protein n=1 Tax=Kribbella turkmenica TaxID=2530375 RepID=UPI0014050831|nr:VOC family protein [Kribbella turkmenica]